MHHPEFASKQTAAARFRHWQSLSDGFLVGLVVVGPTFLFEELWRGKPMIDQGGAWWVVPAVLMAVGFYVSGRVAGRNRGSYGAAFRQGVVATSLVVVLIFLADLIRRVVLTQGITAGFVGIWIACTCGALLAGGLGGMRGRRALRVGQRRHQMERFH